MPVLHIFFGHFYELFWARFLWPIAYTILNFFINLTTVVITENKMLYCTSFYFFKFFCSLRCGHALYCFSTLTLSTVSSIMTLFSIIYTSSIFKPLLLLWGLLKCLSLLESLVWLLLLWLLSVGSLVSGFL